MSSRVDDIARDLHDLADGFRDHVDDDREAFGKIDTQLRNIQQAQAPHTPTAER